MTDYYPQLPPQQPQPPRRTSRTLIAVLVTVGVLGLAGMAVGLTAAVINSNEDSGSDTETTTSYNAAPPPELPAVPAETTTVNPADVGRNERGNLEMNRDDEAILEMENGDRVTFAIDKIVVDPPCGEFGSRDSGKHTLALHVRVSTGPGREAAQNAGGVINPWNFSIVREDGTTEDLSPGLCLDPEKALTTDFGPNQKYRGVMELESPQASGKLMMKLASGGWEWKIGSGGRD